MTRRELLTGALFACLPPGTAHAFGQEGAFNPRALITGSSPRETARSTAFGRWSWELLRRTSAPARLVPGTIAADDPRLLAEPFAAWVSDSDTAPLSLPEVRGLSRFFDLGGVLLVDDSDPKSGAFGRAARRELARVLPESPLVRLSSKSSTASGGDIGQTHVIYKSYYLVDGPAGRVEGPPWVEAIVKGRDVQVIFLAHDLMGALARGSDGTWKLPVEAGGAEQRELAVRFAVNIAMYVLCSNYKDDQVHAQVLMRRRGRDTP